MPKRWIKVNLVDANDEEYAEVVSDVRDALRRSGQQGSVEQDGKADAVPDQ